MSDRLAVMSEGHIAQVGSPRQVYEEPADAYVADFLGVSNLMEAVVERPGDAANPCRLRLGDFPLEATCGTIGATGDVKLAIRPERVRLEPFETKLANCVPAMVERLVFLGAMTQVIVRLAQGSQLQALVHNDGVVTGWAQGTPLNVVLPPESLRVLPGGGASVAEIREETLGEAVPSLDAAGPSSSGPSASAGSASTGPSAAAGSPAAGNRVS